MKLIQNFIEPTHLWLIWLPPLALNKKRSRRVIAKITHEKDHNYTFSYLYNTEDFNRALEEGFIGYPAFKLDKEQHTEYKSGVIESFIRRLPPRNREDFGQYLTNFHLPHDFNGSDMALLAYTGAKLPSDGFELFPDFSNANLPIEFQLEIAGVRHNNEIKIDHLNVDDEVSFIPEKDNPYDSLAIAIKRNQKRIGYVCSPYLEVFHQWLINNKVTGFISRKNGKPERPLIYVFVTVYP